MAKILEEKDFRKAGIAGKISKDDFMAALKEVPTDNEVASSKIAAAFNDIKNTLEHIGMDVKEHSGDYLALLKDAIRYIAENTKTVSELKKELNKPQPKPAKEWKFTIQRDTFGKIKTLTAKREV